MNLLNTILESGQGGVVKQLANNFNLDEGQAGSVLSNLVPALTKGVQKNISSSDGLESLLGALGKGAHSKYLDDLNILGDKGATDEGNSILGHILGSKDASRNVAAHAAQNSGVSADVIKKMLPVVASLAMGALGKKAGSAGVLGSNSAVANGNAGGFDASSILTSFLDADKDGSVVDDVLSLAKKLF